MVHSYGRVMGMVVSEWLDSSPRGVRVAASAIPADTASDATSAGAAPAGPTFAGDSTEGATSAAATPDSTIEAQGIAAPATAALAHELAARARSTAEDTAAELGRGVREGRSAESLAELARYSSVVGAAARKACSQADQAARVLLSLGGRDTANCPDGGPAVGPGGIGVVVSGPALIEIIGRLEETKNAVAAVQAQARSLSVGQQRLARAKAGMPCSAIGRGVTAQLDLARYESPHRGRQLCELAHVLVRKLPHTMNAFVEGKLSEYRAGIIARETVFLQLEDRLRVDGLIAADGDALARMGTREVAAATRSAAYALDPQVFAKRHEMSVGERHVSLRPAADGMTFLTTLMPLRQGVRILATLTKVAESAKASGDERGKGQLMADALIHRLSEHAPCDAGAGGVGDHRGVPAGGFGTREAAGPLAAAPMGGASPGMLCTTVVGADSSLELVMTDRALFGSANDPAVVVGYEPIPAPLARMMVLGGGSGFSPRVWLKRLFTHPESNALLAMDSRARAFPAGMKEFLRIRDQRCQTPYCDAPIRDYDHIKAYATGGPTSLQNGQGPCTACNQAKEAADWVFERGTMPGGSLASTRVTTPTGHRYLSTAPPLPGPPRSKPSRRANRRW